MDHALFFLLSLKKNPPLSQIFPVSFRARKERVGIKEPKEIPAPRVYQVPRVLRVCRDLKGQQDHLGSLESMDQKDKRGIKETKERKGDKDKLEILARMVWMELMVARLVERTQDQIVRMSVSFIVP